MGVGAFPFLRVTRRRHRDREYGTKGRGASHRPALNSNAHYFGRKSSVSGPMYVCCEDSSYRRQALKKCNCTTSTAQDQPSAGQGNIELSLKRGRGCAACTAHRESYGGAGPGLRSQYCEYRWRGDGAPCIEIVQCDTAAMGGGTADQGLSGRVHVIEPQGHFDHC